MTISPQDGGRSRGDRRPARKPDTQGGRGDAGEARRSGGAARSRRDAAARPAASAADPGAHAAASADRPPRSLRPRHYAAMFGFALARAAAPRGRVGISLHPRRGPVPFRRRLLDPLGGSRRRDRRDPRRDHPGQQWQRASDPDILFEIHPQPGDRRDASTKRSICARSTTCPTRIRSSRSATTSRSRICSPTGGGWWT